MSTLIQEWCGDVLVYSNIPFAIINKQMQSSCRGRQAVQFRKANCQLQEFPLIKMHIFSNIQVLDLRNNLISDLDAFQDHTATTAHVMNKLKIVNLSNNQFPNAKALLPLARAAKGIVQLDISGNPLVHTLNFVYEIALSFTEVSNIICDGSFQVQETDRNRIVMHQMGAGTVIDKFLRAVQKTVDRMRRGVLKNGESKLLQGLMQGLEAQSCSIPQQNDLILQTMTRFTDFSSPQTGSPTYRSPLPSSPHEIQVKSEYQVASPNSLARYLSEGDEPVTDLMQFYYKQMAQKQVIGCKLLQEIEVEESVMVDIEEGRREIPLSELLHQMRRKWIDNVEMARINVQGCLVANSPFKSVQTDATLLASPLKSDHMFFAFDKEWTKETSAFLKHRLQSLVRTIIQNNLLEKEQQKDVVPLRTFHSELCSPPLFPSSFSAQPHHQNYQTFGSHSPRSPPAFTSSPPLSPSNSLLSPKSRNKFIIGSLANVLEMILKRIVLRRLRSARLLKPSHVEYFQQILTRIARRSQQLSFRRIFQTSLFLQCLQQKMCLYKKAAILKAWRQVKRRKMKLLKSLLLRKSKKERALLSVFLTQMRVNCSTLGLQRRMMQTKMQMLTQQNELTEVSCILKRSPSYQKHTHLPSRHKDSDRTVQARRNCLKRTK